MKKTILFVSQEVANKTVCGVGVLGTLYGNSLSKSKKYNIKHVYTDTPQKLLTYYEIYKPELILYNFSFATMPWVLSPDLPKFLKCKHALVYHDSNQDIADTFGPEKWYGFHYMIVADKTLSVKNPNNFFTTNRLIPPYTPSANYVDKGIPSIGFQGQLVPEKGLDHLITQVQDEFEEAVINLHCPNYHFGSGQKVWDETLESCKKIITKPGIKLNYNNEILDQQGLVDFLSQNTINCYFYKYQDGAGLASSLDFALASKRPMCITKSYMFRNYWNTPEIIIDNTTIKEVIKLDTIPLERFYIDYSEQSFISDYEESIQAIIGS